MSGNLLTMPVLRAVDQNGSPIAGALLQFYATGTTTPANVYASAALTTPLSNPVVADSGGLFVPIYLDPTVTYRCQLQTAAGGIIRDIDPAAAPIGLANNAVTAAMLQAGVAVANLGYTPLNKAGDTATNLLVANTSLQVNSPGYIGAPINEQDSGYTFALSDCGKMVRCVSATAVTWTIPPHSAIAWPGGTVILLRNAGTGSITVQRGSGVILIAAGTNTNKDYTLAGYGQATIINDAPNDSWVISGVGVS